MVALSLQRVILSALCFYDLLLITLAVPTSCDFSQLNATLISDTNTTALNAFTEYPVPGTNPSLILEIFQKSTITPSPVAIIHVLNLAVADFATKSPSEPFPETEQRYKYFGAQFSMASLDTKQSFTYSVAIACVKALQKCITDEERYNTRDVRVRRELHDRRVIAVMQLGNSSGERRNKGKVASVSAE